MIEINSSMNKCKNWVLAVNFPLDVLIIKKYYFQKITYSSRFVFIYLINNKILKGEIIAQGNL